jgi:hypothetical protein
MTRIENMSAYSGNSFDPEYARTAVQEFVDKHAANGRGNWQFPRPPARQTTI